jgi:hypothetical protein
MASITMAQAYALARTAGFDPAAAVVMAAIDMAESGLDPNETGDERLQNATWGPSIGLAQIRSLKAQTGTGKIRDVATQRDPAANMAAAYEISNHGKDFTPWTTYNSGKYRQFLTQAKAGAAGGATSVTNTGQTVQVGLTDVLTGNIDWRGLALTAAAVSFGLALLVAGAYQAVGGPDMKRAAAAATTAVVPT